jgi:hypothetical protein
MTWTYDPTKPLEVHPLADILPEMTEEEFKALEADIRLNGLQVPIVIFEGKILDGRNRYKAARKMLKQENFRVYEGHDPVAQVLALNVNRRHLSTSQRALIAAKIASAKLGFNQHMPGACDQHSWEARVANRKTVLRMVVRRPPTQPALSKQSTQRECKSQAILTGKSSREVNQRKELKL